MGKAIVYFTNEINPEKIVDIYKAGGKELKGRVAVKVHSGEKGNQNYLKPEMLKNIIEYVGGTVVECNTSYEGARNTTEKHLNLMKEHKWSELFEVDILDSEGPDLVLAIPNGKIIKKNYVGKNIANYDSMLVISHFKGHPMGGYGGALKQLSIGLASSKGKRYIHCAGKENGTYEDMFSADHDKFLESMSDAADSVVRYFKGNIVYINIMCNMSVDCDCCGVAEDPCIDDIGLLASLDPVALDQACVDLVYQSSSLGKDKLIERIESRNGIHTIECSNALNTGTREYEIVEI